LSNLRASLLATLSTLALIASLATQPAKAADTLRAAGPLDITAISPAQRLSLPDNTAITVRGKPLTLGALRTAHTALLAYFQSVASLRSVVHLKPPFRVTRETGSASPILFQAVVGQPATTAPSPVPASTKQVPNATKSGPIDYMAACGQFSVCVFIPQLIPALETANGTFTTGNLLYVSDSLLSSDVCHQDGGTYGTSVGCQFIYQMSAQASVFPGNPPAMTASVDCPNSAFTTLLDPLGAAKITGPPYLLQGEAAIVCAINLFVPS
jgi:hypothetical protein